MDGRGGKEEGRRREGIPFKYFSGLMSSDFRNSCSSSQPLVWRTIEVAAMIPRIATDQEPFHSPQASSYFARLATGSRAGVFHAPRLVWSFKIRTDTMPVLIKDAFGSV